MLTSNQKLIMFMRKKQEELIELGIKDKYFIKKDEKIILSWEEDKCEEIWRKIIQNINDGNNLGLSIAVCPFCIENKSDTCVGCIYQLHHDICSAFDSTYNKIKYKLNSYRYEKDKEGNRNWEPLDKDFYKKIVNEINNMEVFKK